MFEPQTPETAPLLPKAQDQESPATALEQLTDYCLREHHLPSGKTELLRQLILAAISLSGATVYALPAYKYATDHPKIIGFDVSNNNPAIIWSWVIGTTIPAVVVLYNSTYIFLTFHGNKTIPKQLETILSKMSKLERCLENTTIITVSALASVPFAMVSITYPLLKNLAARIIYSTVIQIDNTVLHFLPVQLLLDHPVFSLPLKPFRWLKRVLSECCLNPEALQEKRSAQQKALIHKQLKNSIVSRLGSAQEKIIQETFSFNGSRLSYDIAIPANLKNLDQQTGLQSLLAIAGYAPPIASHEATLRASKISTIINALDWFGKNLAYLGGMFLASSCCIGYFADPITEAEKYTKNYTSASLIAFLPDYCLGTLLAFLGGESMRNLYNYFTTWKGSFSKLPYQAKFYPKSFALFMLLNIYITIFSAAAAKELVLTNFSDKLWDPVRNLFLVLAEAGIDFVGFCSVRDAVLLVFEKLALHCGCEDAKLAMQLQGKIEQLKNFIQLMPGEKLEQSLLKLSVSQREVILGIPELSFQEIISQSRMLATNSASFFGKDEQRIMEHDVTQQIVQGNSINTATMV